MYGQRFNDVQRYVQSIGGRIQDLGYGFAIVNISVNRIMQLTQSPYIQYIELPKSLYLSDASSNTSSCVESARNQFNVDGQGIVIGFIDSGIDFTHPAFRNEDGSTRIEYIYDLSTGGNVYNKARINEALRARDPFSVVPSEDITEHGTHVAGIACAGGRIPRNFYGVAPKSSIMMVKSARGSFALSTQIMKGLKFLVDRAYELKMPLVVNLSLSTNDGAHNGSSLLEQYINTIATLERVTIVVASGNEGDSDHHVGGNLERENTVRFNVASDETSVVINLYKSILPSVTLEIITPNSISTGQIRLQEGYREGIISGNRYQIYNTGPKPFDINGEIGISLTSFGNYIVSGEWTIILRVTNQYKGTYDMWLPILEGLNQRTKFLQPKIDNTLGIPGTVSTVITVGSYNNITMRISSFSGRGKANIYDNFKPDLVAPGESIVSSTPNGSFDRKTGTSMATPHVAGICALMRQWGIVKRNDLFLYGNRLKHYLILGARKSRADITYPDPSWGYGEVCANDAFKSLVEALQLININAPSYRNESYYDEYLIGSLFIRKPNEFFHK